MPTFTVKAASKKKDIPDAKFGPAQVIALKLANGDGEKDAEWFTKATTSLPAVGSTLEGELTQGKFGLDFKRAKSGGGGGGAKDAYWERREQRDIVGNARMGRAHAQEMAVRVAVGAGYFKGEITYAQLEGNLKPLIDWFAEDTDRAGADVGGGPEREVGVPAQPIQRSAADVSASTAQKRAMTTGLRKLGAADDVLALIVHEKAGDPPTKAGASALLDLINTEGITLDQVIEQVGITPPSDIPVDDSELPSGERDEETIL